MKNRKMTKEEMVTACVDDQIARGIIKAENREMQIKTRLTGFSAAGIKAMDYKECVLWYKDVFKLA